jgi:hypothetical protein
LLERFASKLLRLRMLRLPDSEQRASLLSCDPFGGRARGGLKLGQMVAREAMPERIGRPIVDSRATLGGFAELPGVRRFDLPFRARKRREPGFQIRLDRHEAAAGAMRPKRSGGRELEMLLQTVDTCAKVST